jgi:hypothetical protein
LRFVGGREKFGPVDTPPLSLDQLTQETRDAALQVHAAQERLEDRDFIATVHETVDRLGRRFHELLASLSSDDRATAERAVGRRIADVRRMASLLPKVPAATAAVSTPDRQVSGASVVGERRITGVSWTHDRRAPSSGLRVGGEVEAWCGKCDGLKTHNIVAMVGDVPKQVLCQACGSRHTYRTGPARKKDGAEPAATTERRTVVDPEAAKRAEIQRALAEELATASTVRTFNPKERYKAGEIISHPEYGRGKIENVLRSSLLVRFSRAGLKPLMLV